MRKWILYGLAAGFTCSMAGILLPNDLAGQAPPAGVQVSGADAAVHLRLAAAAGLVDAHADLLPWIQVNNADAIERVALVLPTGELLPGEGTPSTNLPVAAIQVNNADAIARMELHEFSAPVPVSTADSAVGNATALSISTARIQVNNADAVANVELQELTNRTAAAGEAVPAGPVPGERIQVNNADAIGLIPLSPMNE